MSCTGNRIARKKTRRMLIRILGAFSLTLLCLYYMRNERTVAQLINKQIIGLLSQVTPLLWVVAAGAVMCDVTRLIRRVVKNRRYANSPLSKLDHMDGYEFEYYAAWILKLMGYRKTKVTKSSGDFGADVIAYHNDAKAVIQVKRYKGNVGIAAIQQVVAAKAHYKATEAVIFTNSRLTKAAQTLAKDNAVTVIDRDALLRFGVKKNFAKEKEEHGNRK